MIPWEIVHDNAAFHIFGFGVGQATVIEFGLFVGATIVVGYRWISRGKRYTRE